MASDTKGLLKLPNKKGFVKWVKLSPDDLPLIKPPRHHMVVHMTGGLASLFKKILEDRRAQFDDEPETPVKPQSQVALEKPDVQRIPLVQFYTEKDFIHASQKPDKNEEGSTAAINGEEPMTTDVSEKQDNGVINENDTETFSKSDGEKSSASSENGEIKGKVDESKEEPESEKGKLAEGNDKHAKNAEEYENREKVGLEKENSNETKKDGEVDSSEKIDDEGGGACSEASRLEEKSDKDQQEEKQADKEETVDKPQKDKADVQETKKPEDAVEEEEEEDDEEEEDEEEESTPYTDEDGEFVPLSGMPLLAGRYKYIQILGRGQSALIVKAEDTFSGNAPLAIKVLHRVYKPIGSQEADILLELHRADPYLHVPFARIKTQFLYGPHYCLVFESLSPTPLYTHYEERDIRGASSLPHVRQLAVKLLTVMGFLHKQNVIHADLKPENILLSNESDLNSIMVVDFGNALRNTEEELSLYYSDFELQTLLYRAPEVIFGLPFSLEVDMWSLGCLLAECYIGKPLFMGKTKHDILTKISKLLGPFPREFSEGKCGEEFAEFIGRPFSRYQRMQNLAKRLNKCTNVQFLMLIERMLTYSPAQRITPPEAACHPFIAYISPFLYLTPSSAGLLRYPTVILDNNTYPFKPEDDENSERTKESIASCKRLLSFARLLKALPQPVSGANTVVNSTGGNVRTLNVPGLNKQNSRDSGVVSRADVKETLKSMGLRCEDFTISVYSTEQTQAILRRQGVEVTNHSAVKQLMNAQAAGQSRNNMRSPYYNTANRQPMSRAQPQRSARPTGFAGNVTASRNLAPPKPQPAPTDDDDDDCVILDPPEDQMPPRRPQQFSQRLPQQFQLLGTTVQVNRAAKRPYSGPQSTMPSKRSNNSMMSPYSNYQSQSRYDSYRPNSQRVHQRQQTMHAIRQQQQYMDDYSDEESSNSVQDTLRKLKNYNISITCRRNEPLPRSTRSGGSGSRNAPSGNRNADRQLVGSRGTRVGRSGMRGLSNQQLMMQQQLAALRSDSDEELPMDSEEDTEADMAKYLECEIGEEDGMGVASAMVEGDEELHFGEDDDDELDEGMMDEEEQHETRPRRPVNSKNVNNQLGRSNKEKGKSTDLSNTKNSKNSEAIRRRNERRAADEHFSSSNAGDTSIEEVETGHGSDAADDEIDSCELKQAEAQRRRSKTSKKNAQVEKQPEDDEHDEEEQEDEMNTSSVAEIILPPDEAAENTGIDKDGNEEEEDMTNPLSDDENDRLVDNLLERHLNAVCGGSEDDKVSNSVDGGKEDEEGFDEKEDDLRQSKVDAVEGMDLDGKDDGVDDEEIDEELENELLGESEEAL